MAGASAAAPTLTTGYSGGARAGFDSGALARTNASNFGGFSGGRSPGSLARHAPPRPEMPGKRGFMSRHKTVGVVVGENSAQATALIGNLAASLKALEDEIAKDEKSLKEMNNNLEKMQQDTDRLGRQIAREEAIVASMAPEQGLGAAMKSFDNFMTEVKGSYNGCREKHKESVQLLKKEFNYNPAYKKGTDKDPFTSPWISLSKDPSKIQRT
eukprot:CAMPEP_0206426378 /NCGR_PEP_ID=MMETSP0324_2-20121206/4339_1 /ASSEMBLY_ACC=CAM_ASM_000836 /TAXON_ID=2866 /ORGANISM="Crypthecodinium cohnii, Strain Seligo" /LENGTH=212 /DNA_ID=CAMNT_0053891315 /DNA_START=27 /DNA_END=665 /DNA_ORIENTATION=+